LFFSFANLKDFTEHTEPFGTFQCANTPQGKHAKPVRLCEFRAICVRTKYLRATNNTIFHYAVPAYGPT
ncbi:MAG: hypothetical protein II200_07785, partial [Bacteroidaceae bacterium]|nr:hypothetical protein [Bacteroidaceae bacterium]